MLDSPSVTLSLELVVRVFVPLITAVYAHEYTHWLAGRLLGGWTRVHHLRLECEYAFPVDSPVWKDRVVMASPVLVGFLAGGLYLAMWGWPPATLTGGLWTAAWVIYTLLGGLDDYSHQLSTGDVQLSDDVVFGAWAVLAIAAAYLVNYLVFATVVGEWLVAVAGPRVLVPVSRVNTALLAVGVVLGVAFAAATAIDTDSAPRGGGGV